MPKALPFASRHIGPSADDINEMLAVVGAGSLDELLAQTLPADIRQRAPLDLPSALSESEALAKARDFAARMAWATNPYGKANHPPVARLEHPDRLTVHGGERFTLSAAGSSDPDGDSLSYLWFNYPEAGSYRTPIAPNGADNIYHVSFNAPHVTKPETAHFILRVTDKGTPPLSRYKRVIVTILP